MKVTLAQQKLVQNSKRTKNPPPKKVKSKKNSKKILVPKYFCSKKNRVEKYVCQKKFNRNISKKSWSE